MAVTQLEIARRVGLDVSSVNKILNRRPGPVFKKETIKQVFKVARELGYDFGRLKYHHKRGSNRRPMAIPLELSIYNSDGTLFDKGAANLAEAARLLLKLLTDYDDPVASHEEILQREHEGDEITHQIMRALNTTFVTPFDRADIYRLASRLDDVLDAAEAVSDLLVLHRIEDPLPELHQQAGVLVRATEVMEKAIGQLRSLQGLNGYLVEVNRLENEGDRVYRKTVARLYSGDFKAMDVLKWKDLVDQMEEAIDGCEDIANTIESLALKHA